MGVALLAALAIGGPVQPQTAADPLRLGIAHGNLALPLYTALDGGLFDDESLPVATVPCSSGVRCMEVLFAGDADVVTATELPAVFAGFERDDFAIIGTITAVIDDVQLVGRLSRGVATVDHLVDAKVGTVRRSTGDYVLDTTLLAIGIDPARVRRVDLQADRAPDAIASGAVDAVAIWQPHAQRALDALGQDGVVLRSPTVYTARFNLVARRAALRARPADFERLLRAIDRAQREIRQQPDTAQALLRTRHGQTREQVARVWDNLHFELTLEPSLVLQMQGQIRWAQREGHVSRANPAPAAIHLIDTAPLSKVRPQAVGVP